MKKIMHIIIFIGLTACTKIQPTQPTSSSANTTVPPADTCSVEIKFSSSYVGVITISPGISGAITPTETYAINGSDWHFHAVKVGTVYWDSNIATPIVGASTIGSLVLTKNINNVINVVVN